MTEACIEHNIAATITVRAGAGSKRAITFVAWRRRPASFMLSTGKRGAGMRTIVVGASAGLGRCIGIGLAQRGADVALLARREDLLADAAKEAGPGNLGIRWDVTAEAVCR